MGKKSDKYLYYKKLIGTSSIQTEPPGKAAKVDGHFVSKSAMMKVVEIKEFKAVKIRKASINPSVTAPCSASTAMNSGGAPSHVATSCKDGPKIEMRKHVPLEAFLGCLLLLKTSRFD